MPRALLETVCLLFAIPNGARQRELLPHTVLVHRPQGPSTQLLSLLVMSFEPQRLQLGVGLLSELVVFQDMVEFPVIATVKGHDGSRAQHRFILVEGLAGRRGHGQRPEEATQAFYVAALLQSLAYPGHLLGTEIQDGQLEHRGSADCNGDAEHGVGHAVDARGPGRVLQALLGEAA